METDNLEEKLKLEINKLVVNKWYFLDKEWPLISNIFNHRSELKHTKVNLRAIKDILFAVNNEVVF